MSANRSWIKSIKPPPLLAVSVYMIPFAVYLLATKENDQHGYLTLWLIILFVASLFSIVLHFLFRWIFGSRVWLQAVTELMLIAIAFLFFIHA